MRCSFSLYYLKIFFLAVLAMYAIPAFAQDPPDVAMGMSPSATYHGGDFDVVDMATGRLNLNIPLVADHSQRGKLNFPYNVTFTSNGGFTNVAGPANRYWLIQTSKYGISGPALVTKGALTGNLTLDKWYDGSNWYYAWSIFEDGFGIGNKHPLGLTNGTGQGGVSEWESIDGSGIRYAYASSNPGTTSKTGIHYSGPVIDPNGNEMAFAAYWLPLNGGIIGTPAPSTLLPTTDTLGRTWTFTQNSSNVSGCPTGGLVAPTSSMIWTIPGPSNIDGGVRTFKFCYSTYSIQTNFTDAAYGAHQFATSASLMTGIVLPDGTTWRFDYDNNSYGDLIKVVPPTGGYISYTWATSESVCGSGSTGFGPWVRVVTSRTVFDGVNSNTWNYTLPQTYLSPYIVTDPLGNATVYTPTAACTIGQIQSYSGSTTSGTLLKTVVKSYRDLFDPFPCDLNDCGVPDPQLLASTTTIWPNGQQSQVKLTYDSGFNFCDFYNWCGTSSYGLVTAESHSDYGSGVPGPIISATNTNYLALTNSTYATANMLDLPSSIIVTDGSGNYCSETDYGYDESTADPSGVTEQHVAAPNSVRGNLTSITKQLFTNPCSSPTPSKTPLKTTKHVYDTGMIHTSTDPLNNPPRTYSYSSTYYGAFPTSVCNPLNQCTIYGYDFNTGLMTSLEDPNIQTTSFTWDCMLRATQATYPDGGQKSISFSYTPSNGGCGSSVSSAFSSATLTEKITTSLNKVTTQTFDGLGRPKQTQSIVPTSTCSSGLSYVDTTYDNDGRQFSVSNPYCTTSDATYGLAKTYYDPLSRPCLVVPPDGTAPSSYSCPATSLGNDVLTAYLGNATTVTDQAGNQRRSISDSAGRLVEVDEPGPGSGTGSNATGIVGIYGFEQCMSFCDAGTVWITVNNFTKSVAYYSSYPNTIAAALASAFNGDNNSPVTASANGSYITLTSKATGTSSDYSVTAGSQTNYPSTFSVPSFMASPASPTLNCGASGSTTVYSVCTPAVTTYAYDALSDLNQVVQAGSRQRTFTYDSLSRLLQAKNPESGTISYVYDADGNVLTKTDARGITISYSPSNATIDPLNRVRGKSYSNGDPEVTYAYDGNAPAGCTPPALSDPYPIGRRTSMCDAAGAEAWSHDPMGRVAVDQRTTNSLTKSTTYGYNLDGSTTALSYPSLRTITYAPNSAAQPVSAKDTAYGINYVMGPAACPNGQTPVPSGGACYTPQGSLARLVNGSNLTTTSFFNTRLQPCRIAVSSSGTAPGTCGDGTNYGNVLDYSYSFNLGASDNGNVYAVTNNLTKNSPSTDRSQGFTYDALNRIATAGTVSTNGTNCWGENYGYDAWGNLLSITGITPQYNGCSQESGFTIAVNANNQIAGFCYDAAGNLQAQSAPPCPSPTYTYNAENQLTSTAGVTYTYDGDGKRVKKSNGKLYWYGTSGDALDETDASGNLTDEYIFFGGKRIARRDSTGNVDYYFADHLGTARVVTNATGTIQDDSDYYPFGGQRALLSSSGNTYKFTGKERDSESGLDNFGARYNSSQYGRFMTPDSLMVNELRLINPQRWNLYSYSINNPITYTDPDGHDAIAVNFAGGVPVGGHQGIIVVHADGQATYARFGPAHADRPFDQGKVTVTQLAPVKFGTNGLPTDASYKELADEAGKAEGQPASTVGFNYFKTSEAESIMLSNWINQFNEKNTPDYAVTGTNCAAFCIAGLLKANAIENKNISLIPDRLFQLLASRANQNYTWQGTTPQKEIVTHCIRHEDGSCQ